MVSERVRNILLRIVGRIPDGDDDSIEPLLTAWADVRVNLDDAEELLAAIELSDWVVGLLEQHGAEKAWPLLQTYVRLMTVPATMETLQMLAKKEPADG
jgi:hypothetical protein